MGKTARSPSLARLTDAVAVLSDETTVLELAVRALHEACPRGVAIGITSRGRASERAGQVRLMHGGRFLELPTSTTHLAYVRTPAYDLANVPVAQRNRWVEPFREGIATREGWKSSTFYPFVRHLGVLDQGRIAVCSGVRQVAFAGAAVPEEADFTEAERKRLKATAEALVVPLRVAAMLGDVERTRTAMDELLEGTTDAVVALDARGTIVGTSRQAFMRLRQERLLPERLREAVRRARGGARTLTGDAVILHVSPCAEPGVRWLVAIDGAAVEPRPILTTRQRELLELLAKGLTNAEIAHALGIAAPTVKTTLERLYRRAGVGSRLELLAWWRDT